MSDLDVQPVDRDIEVEDIDFPSRGEEPTLTAGQIVRWLSRFDPSTPVTVALPDGWRALSPWLNLESCVKDEQSIICYTVDDFDPCQF